jgi:hypothetical protein
MSVIGDLDALLRKLTTAGGQRDRAAEIEAARKETLERCGLPYTPYDEFNPGAPGQMDPPVTVVTPNPGPILYAPPPPTEEAAPPRPAVAAREAAPKETSKEAKEAPREHPPLQRGT